MNKMCPVCGATYGADVVACTKHPEERLMLVDAETNFIGQVLDGKYKLVAKLGEGGMGSVYLGIQSQIDREVAVKILRSEFKVNSTAVKRFLREARAASKLSHPNSITVYDFGQAMSGDLYIVMERLTGVSLADVLDDAGPMPVERAVRILTQICDSLTEAHRLGITHRDLKPENIHIEQKAGNPDFVKVLDFGIAKMRADSDDTNKATQTGMICGTPSYMSPEQAMGRELDGRSDLYALGILLYEMLTNQRPFEGDAAMEVMLKHINEPPPDIFQRTGIRVPAGIQDAIEKLLAKDPARRPPHCEEVKRILQQGLKTELIGPIDATTDTDIPAKRRAEARSTNQEKTGLAPAVPVPTTTERSGMLPRPRSGSAGRSIRTYVVTALNVIAVGGAAIIGFDLLSGKPAELATSPAVAVELGANATGAVAAAPAGGEPGAGTSDADGPGASTPPPETGAAAERVDAPAPSATGDQDAIPSEAASPTVAGASATDTPVGVPRDVPGNPPPAEAPAPVEMTVFKLDSVPSGASVFEEDVLLGNTPLEFSRKKHSGAVRLTLRMKGYVDRPVALGTVADGIEETYTLEKARRSSGGARLQGGSSGGFQTF
jgi:serine/threonine protein kinase